MMQPPRAYGSAALVVVVVVVVVVVAIIVVVVFCIVSSLRFRRGGLGRQGHGPTATER